MFVFQVPFIPDLVMKAVDYKMLEDIFLITDMVKLVLLCYIYALQCYTIICVNIVGLKEQGRVF